MVLEALSGIATQEIAVFLISLLPVLELRGGLLAASYLGIDLVRAFLICVAGCFLPVPFILLTIRKVLQIMRTFRLTEKLAGKLEHRAMEKSDQIGTCEFWGLFLFVAAPLPGTGAWTGALVAALLGMKHGRAALAIFLGVLVSGFMMAGVAYGILDILWR